MRKSFFKRMFIQPLKEQLTQGISPRSLALACTVGVAIGTFPVFGATTSLCLIAGALLKLNMPILQAINYLLSPVQILAIPVFVHFGCVFTGSPLVTINPLQVIGEFKSDVSGFFAKYTWIGIHAIFAWAVIIPWVAIGVYVIALFALNAWSRKISRRS